MFAIVDNSNDTVLFVGDEGETSDEWFHGDCAANAGGEPTIVRVANGTKVGNLLDLDNVAVVDIETIR